MFLKALVPSVALAFLQSSDLFSSPLFALSLCLSTRFTAQSPWKCLLGPSQPDAKRHIARKGKQANIRFVGAYIVQHEEKQKGARAELPGATVHSRTHCTSPLAAYH